LRRTEAELKYARRHHQDDLAVVLIQKKNPAEQDLADMRGELDTAQKDATSGQSSILNVQAPKFSKLKPNATDARPDAQSAQARLRFRITSRALSSMPKSKALEPVS